MNQMLHLHRVLNAVAGGVVAVLIIVIVVMSFQSPLVIVTDGFDKHYRQTERKADSITEKDVENFVREFMDQLFTWEKLSPEVILRQVSPLVTSGLLDRISLELSQKAEKDFKGKTLSQEIVGVSIKVTPKEVIASFDKVLKINGVSIVIPSQMSFNIIRGGSTRWNPMGLYVNGLIEHEGTRN
ncbi:MAG: hypothetical protein KF865_11750 [Bdellovibrionaceae bacterium]|nr:hypothetical protein [Pseudobdellovibrionaceae bacterium]